MKAINIKRILIPAIIILMLLPAALIARQIAIEGRVVNEKGEPLSGTNIMIAQTTIGTISDQFGKFYLAGISSGTHRLVISYVGYEKAEREVEVVPGEISMVDVVLSKTFDMPQIELIGASPGRFERVPGSASLITSSDIREVSAVSSNEIFRRISGVHAVEEEGLGLRANIGIRGLDPDKSRTVLVLEDGIPVALAPYGEPEMYYTPSMDRMAGVEVVKGSGSIIFGPQTFGGVINYLTANPPATPTTSLHLRGGQHGFFVGRIGYGTTVGNAGFQVNYLRKQGNNVGILDFSLNDLTAKFKLISGDRSVLGLKLGVYDENSNSTYIGLTQAMFDSGRFDFTHLAPDDQLSIRRYSLSATHDVFFSDNLRLRTTAYGYTTSRNWSRQDFDNSPVAGREYIRTVGNTSQAGGAIWFRNQTGNRNRQFEVGGIEPRLTANFEIGSTRNELDTGVRYLYERAFEQRINGQVISPTTGSLRDDEIRTGHAISGYVQNKIGFTDRFSVTPGVRIESFSYSREILRLNFVDVDITSEDYLLEVIPGAGFSYVLGEGSSFFGGIHRGFGPPRVKDAISSTGQSEELDAEKSWNFELGTRSRLNSNVSLELTAFWLDFSNQVIPVSESSGGQGVPGATGLTNGGSTRHYGIESGLILDNMNLLADNLRARFQGTFTWTNATFSEDRFVMSGGESVNVKGNMLPYAPKYLVNGVLDFFLPSGIEAGLTATYIAEQYGDVLNLGDGSLNGRQGTLDSYLVLDARALVRIPRVTGLSLSVAVKNLLDERYIVSRRPQGIRVGLPRFITVGLDFSF
ncbi:MAG: carboxypeptidase-like regulatory domain-containing protein [Rhodothermaceae bacterium]|nr:carboxypeptidase-like regulatory domain-containing protein [Rhodothermaceae bacterium]